MQPLLAMLGDDPAYSEPTYYDALNLKSVRVSASDAGNDNVYENYQSVVEDIYGNPDLDDRSSALQALQGGSEDEATYMTYSEIIAASQREAEANKDKICQSIYGDAYEVITNEFETSIQNLEGMKPGSEEYAEAKLAVAQLATRKTCYEDTVFSQGGRDEKCALVLKIFAASSAHAQVNQRDAEELQAYMKGLDVRALGFYGECTKKLYRILLASLMVDDGDTRKVTPPICTNWGFCMPIPASAPALAPGRGPRPAPAPAPAPAPGLREETAGAPA